LRSPYKRTAFTTPFAILLFVIHRLDASANIIPIYKIGIDEMDESIQEKID